MHVSDAIALWLGPPERQPGDACALFLAAGFTRSCWRGAPLFNEYVPVLRKALVGAPIRDWLLDQLKSPKVADWDLQVTDLVETFDRTFGRRAVVDTMLAEPAPSHTAFVERVSRPGGKPLPPRAESAYRTLGEWRRIVTTHRATHLGPLRPGNAAVLVGRLVADGVLQTLLTTNWDAYTEFGCELVGVPIHRWMRGHEASGSGMQVYDCPEATALRPRRARRAVLLKLHGSVDQIHDVMSARGRLPQEIERDLGEVFLVSSSDLTHWRGSSQWVQDAVADGLRSHRTLFLGASGADPVSFRAVRDRIAEWEDRHRAFHQRAAHKRHSPGVNASERVPDHPPVVAVDPRPGERLHAMFAVVRGPRGSTGTIPTFQVARAFGGPFLRAAYAWALLQRILGPLANAGDLAARLSTRLRVECDDSGADTRTPLVDLLCDAIGPGLRWAALAEHETFVARLAPGALHRYHYAPWRESAWSGAFDIDHLRAIAQAVDVLARARCQVDPRSALVFVPAEENGPVPRRLAGRSFLLMPWPRPPQRGLRSARLRCELGALDGLLGNRPSVWSLTARASVLPIPGLPDSPRELRFGDAWLRVEDVPREEWTAWSEA